MKPSHMWEISTHPHSLNLLIKEMWTKFDCLHFDPDRFSLEDACSSVSDENNTQNLQRTEWDFDAPPFSKLTDSHPVANTCNYKLLAVSEENDTRNLQRTKWDFDAPPFSKLTDTPIPLPTLLGYWQSVTRTTLEISNVQSEISRHPHSRNWLTPPFRCQHFWVHLSYSCNLLGTAPTHTGRGTVEHQNDGPGPLSSACIWRSCSNVVCHTIKSMYMWRKNFTIRKMESPPLSSTRTMCFGVDLY